MTTLHTATLAAALATYPGDAVVRPIVTALDSIGIDVEHEGRVYQAWFEGHEPVPYADARAAWEATHCAECGKSTSYPTDRKGRTWCRRHRP